MQTIDGTTSWNNLKREQITMQEQFKTKKPLRSILIKMRDEMLVSQEIYSKLKKYGESSLSIKPELHDDINGLIYFEDRYVGEIVDTIVNTINEYIDALDSFTLDQLAAFYLGLGFGFGKIDYWGISDLQEYYERILYNLALHEENEKGTVTNSTYTCCKRFFRVPNGLHDQSTVKASASLKEVACLVESVLKTLEDRPF